MIIIKYKFAGFPCIAPMENLYIELPAQVYAALQSPRGQVEHLWRQRVERETVQGGHAAGEQVRSRVADGTAGRDGTSGEIRWVNP